MKAIHLIKASAMLIFTISVLATTPTYSQVYEVPDPPEFNFAKATNVTEERLQDLLALEPFLELNKSYTSETRTQAGALLNSLRNNVDNLTHMEFLFGLQSIVALGDNGHSEGRLALFPQTFGSLPFRGYWFDSKYHIIRVKPGYEDLLGARVTHYGDVSIEEVNAQMSVISGGTLEFFRSVSGDSSMATPALLHHMGFITSPNEVEVHFVFPDGSTDVRLMEPSQPGQADNPSTAAGRMLFPRFDMNGWTPLEFSGGSPLYLKGDNPLGEPFQYRALGVQGTPYFQMRGNSSTRAQSLPEFIIDMEGQMADQKYPVIIADLRLNQGGDTLLTAEFMLSLPNYLTENGKIYVVLGNRTFSAGMNAAALIKYAGGDRVMFIGENVGDREQYWSETNRYALPNSDMRVTYAVGLHDLENGCADRPECYWWWGENVNPAIGEILPDIFIVTTFEDYSSGSDPVLIAISKMEGIELPFK